MDIQKRRPMPLPYQERKTSLEDSELKFSPKTNKLCGIKNRLLQIQTRNIVSHFSLRKSAIVLGGIVFLVGGVFIYRALTKTPTLADVTGNLGEAGQEVVTDMTEVSRVPFAEKDGNFQIQEDGTDGIKVEYPNQPKPEGEQPKGLGITFPKKLTDPISFSLDEKRKFQMIDESGIVYESGDTMASNSGQSEESKTSFFSTNSPFWKRLFGGSGEIPRDTLRYESQDGRKSILYSYQKDSATGEKRLRQWTLYREGNGQEQERYRFEGATIKINAQGEAEVRYQSDQDIKNQAAAKDVDPSLLERAQKFIQADLGDDAKNQTPADAVIPRPFYLDKDGKRMDLEWQTEGNTLKLAFEVDKNVYPIALDPTLQFTASGSNSGGTAISGEATSNYFGTAMTSGDFNTDGKLDLAVGAYGYSSSTGRVYIFYGKGSSAPVLANSADVTILGENTADEFGYSLAAGDINSDGKIDLVAGADTYPGSNNGRVYVFYNDGSIPTTAATADITITASGNSLFGKAIAVGDLNADGRSDLIVGASNVGTGTGRAYIFYNDGSIPTTAATADVTIAGEAVGNQFGYSLATGDVNQDGRIDLVVGAYGYSSQTGRAYIFYNDGSIPTTAATADVIITGETTSNTFGRSLVAGDLNADGRADLAVGADGYSSSTGRAYIFYNDGSIPTTAATADVIITGETTSNTFGRSLVAGDLNADGRADLAVGADGYSSSTGRAYIFYNDGSIPTTAATADVIITGETTSNTFGTALSVGDFNSDGKIDLATGASGYSSSTGRTYIFYSQNGQVHKNFSIGGVVNSKLAAGDLNSDGKVDLIVGSGAYGSSMGRAYIFYSDGSIPSSVSSADFTITGNATGDEFGNSLTTGDLNSDGKIDLIVGAGAYSSNTGRAYIFYNDGSIPTTAATADVTITGNATSDYFGGNYANEGIITTDINSDGRTDLIVASYGYSSNTGRAYIFYNDGSIPTTAATADVTITGETTSNFFGESFGVGDVNSDGRSDLIVGANGYSSNTGRAYIFYNDGSIPTTAATADVIITGNATGDQFGRAVSTGDFNTDGRLDMIVTAESYSSTTGRAYIFYNDGSIPTTAATADVTITGVASSYFGSRVHSADLNGDGRTDIIVSTFNSTTGNVYIFYNDGSIPTTAATADVIISGATGEDIGLNLISGDFNADGKTDLAVAGDSSNPVYVYETRDNFSWQFQRKSGSSQRVGIAGGQEITIDGKNTSATFGSTMVAGDFNADGKLDLAVSSSAYSSSTGRVYIFYNNGKLSSSTDGVDSITGETGSTFGSTLIAGDFNSDGKTDLVVGAPNYSTNTGRAYIFYNDGSIPDLATNANVTITGNATNDYFGSSLAVGDFNADSKKDLAVGARGYSSSTGRAYIFYNDGSIPTTAATADVTITGNATNDYFGITLAAGDLNTDGRTDLVVGAQYYPSASEKGRAYIFYNDGSIPTTAATADVTITGTSNLDDFAVSLVTGDFNADGRVDLAVGAYGTSASTGSVYIFYNDGSIPTTAATADVTITGGISNDSFGLSISSGDLNADGRTDLVVAAPGYSGGALTGRVYIFYNDGSIPTNASTADVTLTGENTGDAYGTSLAVGDMNRDGRDDLLVGATGYSSSKGRVYLYTTNDTTISSLPVQALATGDLNADGRTDLIVGDPFNSTSTGRVYIFYGSNALSPAAATADVTITGESTSNYFGASLATGDLNADGKTDLVIGAYGYSSVTGRAYILYNDGSIPTTGATADVIITGGATGDSFGISLTTGDLNSDSKIDLAVGAGQASSFSGRVYIFYNDGSIPTTAGTADVTITGEANSYLGYYFLTTGDLNSDGRTDLVAGGDGYSSDTGRAYIFYNDGSIPTTAATADVTITGESTANYFGWSLTTGDLNSDGRTDLIVGANGPTTSGKAYIFYNDGTIPTTAATADVIITGESGSYLSRTLSTADLNSDGRTDLIVGAHLYSSSTGRVYTFYNDGTIPTTAATADVTVSGSASSNSFGQSLAVGDMNQDGTSDLIVAASGVSKVHIFISETNNTSMSTEDRALQITGSTQWRGSGNIR